MSFLYVIWLVGDLRCPSCKHHLAVPASFLQNIEPLRVLPANHRASGCALECCLEGFAALDGHKSVPSRVTMCLEARGMAIAMSDELQESVGQSTNQALTALCGRSVSVRRSSCKTSRESICPGVLSGGVRGARWTQIDVIARADVSWRPVEWRLLCQMNCRNVRDWALTGL